MALVVKTSTLQTVTLPLACDPSVVAANPRPEDSAARWPLALYLQTGDPRHPAGPLVVPPDACHVTLRPLSKREMLAAHAAAGERPEADAVVWADTVEQMAAARDAGKAAAAERVLASLTPEQRAAYKRHDELQVRIATELARAGLVKISDLPDLKRGARGYPVEDLQALDEPAQGSDLGWPPGLDSFQVLFEVAQHITRISTLGKALGPSSASESGSPTTTPSAGDATARDGAADTSPGPDPSRP